jgi:hypothetical protein
MSRALKAMQKTEIKEVETETEIEEISQHEM